MCAIVDKVGSKDAMQIQMREAEVEENGGRFGREASATVGNADPVSDFSVLMNGIDLEATGSAEFSGLERDRKDGRDSALGVVGASADELDGVGMAVGMWNAEGGGSDFARTREPY